MPRTCSLLLVTCAVLVPAIPAHADELDAEGSTIVVTAEASGYRDAVVSGTKTGIPLLDTPQAIATLSRDQLDDQGVEQLNDALRYVPGVVLGQGEGHRDQVVLRGQSSTADFFLDGLRDDAQYYRPLFNTERVEVLKGANALLFGRGGGGGVINRVSKTPSFAGTKGGLTGGVDSFGAWSLAADLDKPLSDAAALRLNGTYEEFANHRDSFDGHFIGLAPTLAARLGEATTLTLAYEFDQDSRMTDRGVPSLGGVPISGHDRTFFGDPAINRSKVTAHLARARIDHAFSDGLTANLSVQYARYDKYYGNLLASSATASSVTLTGYDSAGLRENRVVQGNLVWKGDTAGLSHTVLAGFEAADQDSSATRRDAVFAAAGGGTASSATVPLARSLILPAASWSAVNRSTTSSVRSLSAHVQDQIALGDHLQLVAGLRYDDFRITSLNRINQFAAIRGDGKWSPRLGLIVKPRETMSFYVSYAKSFLPQSGDQFAVLDATTATLAPEEFRNIEAGVKWDLRRALAFTAALYQVDRSNTRSIDPVTGNPVLTGRSRVKGVELSLAGRIMPQWQASLGYALQDGRIITATTAAPAGRRLAQLPRHQFSAWSCYDVSRKLGLGLGLVHQSSQFATISNAVRLPGFTRFDAAIYYDVSDRVTLQLNAENLTDTRYYPSAHTDNNISTGEPLNAKLTARVKF
ncbi:MAG: TonB-dependent siderophore receptor [Sphingomonadales bacterium]|nr:TonB-dependent siderophore receptor [Sphingomonadales bacterium]